MEKKKNKPAGYWTYERCKEEAKKYKTKIDFRICSTSAYVIAKRNGWLNDYAWFVELRKPSGYWTKERCYEEAKKYRTKSDFRRGCSAAYNVSLRNGWMNYFVFEEGKKPNGYWNYEHCKEDALKYETRGDFQRGSHRAYTVAWENGWLDTFTWLKKTSHKGDDYWVYAYEDVENKAVYIGLTWRKERHREHKNDKTDTVRLYFESINKPLLEPRVKMDGLNAEDAQYYEDWYKQKYAEAGWKVLNRAKTGVGTGSLGSSVIKWDYEHCKEEAMKYDRRSSFQKGNASAYDAARKNGWLDEWFEKNEYKHKYYWTYEKCKEESKKYKTRKDFLKACSGAFTASYRNGWLKDFGFEPRKHWKDNYKHCKEEAKKYETRGDFRRGSNGAYKVSWKNGWLDEFFPKAA